MGKIKIHLDEKNEDWMRGKGKKEDPKKPKHDKPVKKATEVCALEHARLVHNVVVRVISASEEHEAMVFPSEEALKTYLKEHPKAEARNHKVQKPKHDDKAAPADAAEVAQAAKLVKNRLAELEHALKRHHVKEDSNYVVPLSEQMPGMVSAYKRSVEKMCGGVNSIPAGKERDRAKKIVQQLDKTFEDLNKELGFRWETGSRRGPYLNPDQIERTVHTTKPLVEELDKLLTGQRTLLARVVARVANEHEAMEFATPEALEKYMKDHPKADPKKHKVKGAPSEGGSEPKAKRFDHPEFKEKGSPYYVNEHNKWLGKMGDPATWNYSDAMHLREKLKRQPLVEGTPAEKERSEAIRQITNWGMLVHNRNPGEVDKDMGMG